jgi:hypothetical protein
MKAISDELLKTINELQSLKSLSNFSLGGGSNLAIRYNHRISIDIDLFCPDIIGKAGFDNIVKEIRGFYGKNIFGCDFPCEIDDQFIFLRFFVKKNETVVKVEVLQNFKLLDRQEVIAGLNLLSEKDIGMLKLMSLSNRASNKDVYDLDHLTDHISLIDIYRSLKHKQEIFNKLTDQNIFDLDKEESPVNKPELLLKFDMLSTTGNGLRPSHTNDKIVIAEGQKSWLLARSSWRRKVRELYNYLGRSFPNTQGTDL